MVKALLLLLLMGCSCFGQGFKLKDQSFLGVMGAGGTEVITNITAGLISYWKIDEGTGRDVVNYVSGHNPGALMGSPFPYWATDGAILPGRNPNCLSFNGASSYLNVGFDNDYYIITNSFTITMWARYTNTTPRNFDMAIFGHYSDTTHFVFEMLSGYYQFFVLGPNYIVGPSASSMGTGWVFWSLVRNNTVYSIYTNGVAAKIVTSSNPASAQEPCYIAIGCDPRDPVGNPRNWQGEIEEVRIYKNVALSDDQIDYLYHKFYGQP